MRVSRGAWLLVVAGGALFGAALIVTARVLPTGEARTAAPVVDRGGGVVLTPLVEAADGDRAATAIVAGVTPEASGGDASRALRVLDLRITEPSLRDRNGNAPRRRPTAAELASIAAGYDVVADDLAGQPDGTALTAEDIAALHRAHPGIRVVRVLETLTSNDPAYAGMRPDDGTHASWFLSDAGGQPALVYGGQASWNGEPNFALDPANDAVRLAIAARARQYALLGYDGVWLAGLSASAPEFAGGAVVGAASDRRAWRAASSALIAEVRRLMPDGAIYIDAGLSDAGFARETGVTAATR